MDVQLVLLKALAGMGARPQEQPLREGAVLPGRVLKGGAIMLAGVRLAATLPPGLEPGALVRLKVREASAERLVLQVVDQAPEAPAAQAPAAPAAPVPTVAVALPGGAAARLLLEAPDPDGGTDPSRAARGRSTVTLRYESAGLGRVDLALTLEGGAVRAVAHVPAGEVAQRLRAASGDLRAALTGALGRPATVDVVAHAEVLDVSA
ncbi:MAG: flagellar hook-length control protein FliK [Actinobacteria bacterium]|nr:MAG: flagellar hook-length control protein FliK [Actinomycetota bacterium]